MKFERKIRRKERKREKVKRQREKEERERKNSQKEENDIKNFCLELDFEVQSTKLGISKLEEKFSDLNLDLKCNINKSNTYTIHFNTLS